MRRRVAGKLKVSGATMLLAISSIFVITGCTALKEAAGALNAFRQLQFKLGDVNNFKLAGVNISTLQNPKNISISDGINLLNAFNKKQLPVSFRLNVEAKNPNASSSGSGDFFVKKMDFTLYIDNKKTIDGSVADRLRVPPGGATAIIPVDMSLDLMKFFGEKQYDDLLNLAFAIGGVDGSSSRLKLGARVTVETPLGDVRYPEELTIVNASFTNN